MKVRQWATLTIFVMLVWIATFYLARDWPPPF